MDINKFNAKKIFGLIQENKLNLKTVMTIFAYLKLLLLKLEGQEYIYWLKYLAKMISTGYGQMVLNDISLQKRMIHMINLSFDAFIVTFTNKTFGYTIFQISVFADLIRWRPKFIFPYNMKFIENTIKLSQFTGLIKGNESKINLIISNLYLSFTQNIDLLVVSDLQGSLKQSIVQHITKVNTIKSEEEVHIIFTAVKNLLKIQQDSKFKLKIAYLFGQLLNKTQMNQAPLLQ